MNAVQIAGCSCAGKSAVAAVLARRGVLSVDADDDPLLARFVDRSGAVVADEPSAPDLAWLSQHDWAWDPARLDELIRAAWPATLYVCGGADNQDEVADRSDRLRASGAIAVDARQPLDQVADAILSRALTAPPQAAEHKFQHQPPHYWTRCEVTRRSGAERR